MMSTSIYSASHFHQDILFGIDMESVSMDLLLGPVHRFAG
ncbi:hypothetical protein LINPERPRIM_LOCUS37660 [Linum perenne]